MTKFSATNQFYFRGAAILAFFLCTSIQASDLCTRLALELIHVREKSLIVLREPITFNVGGQNYLATAILGKSSSVVYLAHNESGQQVVIKKVDLNHPQGPTWVHSFEYESAVTKFYEELHRRDPAFPLVVPVIAVDKEQGLIVKQYKAGLTFFELDVSANRRDVNPGDVEPLNLIISRAYRIPMELYGIHRRGEFERWLEEHHYRYRSWPWQIQSRILRGDGKVENLIYSPTEGWIIIDP